MILHASCPWCCSSDRPSHISGVALTVVSCKRRPRILHTVKWEGKWKKKRCIRSKWKHRMKTMSLTICLIFVQWNRDVEKEIQTPTESYIILYRHQHIDFSVQSILPCLMWGLWMSKLLIWPAIHLKNLPMEWEGMGQGGEWWANSGPIWPIG